MLKNKILLLSLIILFGGVCSNAETLSEVGFPKPPFYRVGISELPETQYVQAKQQKKVKLEKTYAPIDDSIESNITDVTYADLSIKRLSKEIAQELEYDEQDMIADLSLLWQGAALQSDTINFALYKLANPDADKPDSKSIKNVLKTIASMSTLVGASVGSPIIAGSSLIGGNILGIMSQDTKALNYKYTKVTDADMIILIRKIEDLQQNAVNLYYDYMSAKKQLEMTTKLVDERQHKFELAQKNNAPRELVVITDAYYRTAIDKQRTAKSEFFSKRAALEQFVGNEAFVQFESDLTARENGEKPSMDKKNEDEPAYSDTIQNVENYTNNLNNTSVIETDSASNYAQEEDEIDPNLDKVPELRPLNIDPQTAPDTEFEKEISEQPAKSSVVKFESKKTDQERKSSFKSRFSQKYSAIKEKKNSPDSSPEIQVKEEKKSAGLKSEKTPATKKITGKGRNKNSGNIVKNTDEETSETPAPAKKQKSEKAAKPVKNSTKGLIFLHDKDKTEVKKSSFGELEPLAPDIPVTQVKPKTFDDLPPLDEIKVPDLDGKGYSIYSEGEY